MKKLTWLLYKLLATSNLLLVIQPTHRLFGTQRLLPGNSTFGSQTLCLQNFLLILLIPACGLTDAFTPNCVLCPETNCSHPLRTPRGTEPPHWQTVSCMKVLQFSTYIHLMTASRPPTSHHHPFLSSMAFVFLISDISWNLSHSTPVIFLY